MIEKKGTQKSKKISLARGWVGWQKFFHQKSNIFGSVPFPSSPLKMHSVHIFILNKGDVNHAAACHSYFFCFFEAWKWSGFLLWSSWKKMYWLICFTQCCKRTLVSFLGQLSKAYIAWKICLVTFKNRYELKYKAAFSRPCQNETSASNLQFILNNLPSIPKRLNLHS